MIIGTIALIVTGAVVATLVALCSSGVIRRNPVVGIRVPTLLASVQAWTVGHRAALMPAIVAAVASLVLGVTAILVPSVQDWGLLLAGGPVLVGLIWATARASRASSAVAGGSDTN